MSKCLHCGLEIADPSERCPFCNCMLSCKGAMPEATYPDISRKRGRSGMAQRIYLFTALAGYVILFLINRVSGAAIRWDLLAAAGLVYVYLTWRLSFTEHNGYLRKVLAQTYGGLALVIFIDVILGFAGWSLTYVMPGVFVLLDVAILVLMIVNSRNWQSYLTVQILLIVCSLIPLGFYRMQWIDVWYPAAGCLGFVLLVFLGTVIIGGKRSMAELHRRFHM